MTDRPVRLKQADIPRLLEQLYDLLLGVATRGEACPPGVELARRLGVEEGSVTTLMRKLSDARRIRVAVENLPAGNGQVNRYRVVWLIGTGLMTSPRRAHGVGHVAKIAPALDDLDRAKNFLRQRGPTVYAAAVTHGRQAGDLIVVDRQMLTPAQLLDRAKALGFERSDARAGG